MMRTTDPQSTAFNDISSLILTLLRYYPVSHAPADVSVSSSRQPSPQISPAGFASLMLGMSMALMLCGSVTFIIGFMLMPWVLGFVIVMYLFGLVSMLARALVFHVTSPPTKGLPEWKLL